MAKWSEKQKTELMYRIFKEISFPYFNDHKCNKEYCEKIQFNRSVGVELANFLKAKDSKRYHKLRKKVTKKDEE